jgi:hypothetical protein
MGAKDDAAAWAEAVRALAEKRDLRFEPVGGINPKGGPVALCPGGTNRITGELDPGFWGASCDADERLEGGFFGGKAVVPRAVLIKMHAPEVADVMPPFNVESIEARPGELLEQRTSRRKVEFESLEFNRRYLATVPKEHDPVAVREMFSPGFLDWATTISNEVDFGVSEKQGYMLWRLRGLTADEYENALHTASGLFRRVAAEIEEHGAHTYQPGPWHAGLESFPDEKL